MRNIQIRRIWLLSAALTGVFTIIGCAQTRNCDTEVAASDRAETSSHKEQSATAPANAQGTSNNASSNEAHSVSSVPHSPAVTAPPSIDELPNLKPLTKRSIAARIDVEGSEKISKRRLVPDYSKLELSPEEKKALGQDKPPPPDDVLAFYKPSPNPDKGSSNLNSDLRIGIGGRGGAMTGLSAPPTKAYAFGNGGAMVDPNGLKREGAMVYNERDRRWEISFPWTMRIGEGTSRKGAEQMPVDEP